MYLGGSFSFSAQRHTMSLSPHFRGMPMKQTEERWQLPKPTFKALERKSHCMEKLYTSSHRSHSASSPQRVLGRFSNPTLLCAEAKAQFPASKGPLFGLYFQISASWAWTILLLRALMPWQQKPLPAGLWSSQLSKSSMWSYVYS